MSNRKYKKALAEQHNQRYEKAQREKRDGLLRELRRPTVNVGTEGHVDHDRPQVMIIGSGMGVGRSVIDRVAKEVPVIAVDMQDWSKSFETKD